MWSYIFIGFFVIIFLTVFLNWLFYDLLIRIESRRFPLDWAKDGNPIGMFHIPPDSPLLRGSVSRNRLMVKWIFQKPSWITKDEKAERFYKYFRLAGVIYCSEILLFAVSFVVIFLIQP